MRRTALRLSLTQTPTLLKFVEGFLIPYLFGHAYFTRHGMMPFGELATVAKEFCNTFAALFGAAAIPGVEDFVLLASLKKRVANKHPCPCRSGRRLGRCHNRRVNQLRYRLGRRWFRDEHRRLIDYLDPFSGKGIIQDLTAGSRQTGRHDGLAFVRNLTARIARCPMRRLEKMHTDGPLAH